MPLNNPEWMDLAAIAHAALCITTTDGVTASLPDGCTVDLGKVHKCRPVHAVKPRTCPTDEAMLRLVDDWEEDTVEYDVYVVLEIDQYVAALESGHDKILIPLQAYRKDKASNPAWLCIVWSLVEQKAVNAWVGIDNHAQTGNKWAVVPLSSPSRDLPPALANAANYTRKALQALLEAWPGDTDLPSK